jgi:hypothetical protein
MSERNDLLALGFNVDDDGTLRIRNVNVSLTPLDGRFFRVAIALPHGDVLSCIIPRAALKTIAPEIDIDGLMNVGPSRRRPW